MLEASSHCQLRCPSCPTTDGSTQAAIAKGVLRPEAFRRLLGELVRALQATWLLVEASTDTESEKADVAAFFIRRRVTIGHRPESDGEYAALIDRVLTE